MSFYEKKISKYEGNEGAGFFIKEKGERGIGLLSCETDEAPQ